MQASLWPVDVICLNSTRGELRPLRIRAVEGMEEPLIGNVSEILATRETGFMGGQTYTFLCRIRSARAVTVLELRYFMRTNSWYISRPGR